MLVPQDDIWLALQSNLIAACHNWRLTRLYSPSLTKRSEGWTEKWGTNDATAASASSCWQMERESVQQICATEHPFQAVTLFQYRPAWTEQLALRVANVPYTVVNCRYAVTEMTGPLPYLRELQPNLPPVLTGRDSDSGDGGGNAILQYLRQERGIDLDEPLHTNTNKNNMNDDAGTNKSGNNLEAMSQLYTNLIRNKLQNALSALRYQDGEAWDQVYRPQCLQAASGRGANQRSTSSASAMSSWFRFPGWYQAWSERVHGCSMMSHDTRSLTTEQAVQQVRDVYAVLEEAMEQHGQGQGDAHVHGRVHLLGTVKPVTVDLLLWDHLMQALMDVHLVVVLADFPVLCRYVQQIWDKYFAAADADADTDSSPEWKEWNVQENARNAFAQLPLLQAQTKKEPQTFRKAVELMEQLSVRAHDLHETVTIAKEVRDRQEQMLPKRKAAPFSTWHRWRMGDQLYPTPVAQPKQRDATSDRDEEMKKEFRRNDEVWMTGVGVVTALTAVMFIVSSTQGEE